MSQEIQRIQVAIDALESTLQAAEQLHQTKLANFLKGLVAVRKTNQSWIEKSDQQRQLQFLEMLEHNISICRNLLLLQEAVNFPANNPTKFLYESKDNQVRQAAIRFVPTTNKLIDHVINILSHNWYHIDAIESNTYSLINNSLSNLISIVKNNFNDPQDLRPLLQNAKQLTRFSMTLACMRHPNLTAFCGIMISVVGLSLIITGAIVWGLTGGAGMGIGLPMMLAGASIIPMGVGLLKSVGFKDSIYFESENETKVRISDYGNTLSQFVHDEKITLKLEAAEKTIIKAASKSSTIEMAPSRSMI